MTTEQLDIILSECRLLAQKGAAPPSHILLFREGETGIDDPDDGEQFIFDRQQADRIIAEFRNHGADVPIDYHHTTENPDPNVKAIAAGWIKNLMWVGGQGLVAEVEWTAKAQDEISSQQYRYFSPAFLYRDDPKEIVQLTSVALTNKPRTRNQTELLRQQAAEQRRRRMSKSKKRDDKRKKRRVYLGGGDWSDDHRKTLLAKCEELLPDVEVAVEALPDEQIETLDAVGAMIAELAPLVGVEPDAGTEAILTAAIEKCRSLEDGGEPSTEAEKTVAEMEKLLGVKGVKRLAAEINKMKSDDKTKDQLQQQVNKLTAEVGEMVERDKAAKVDALVTKQVEAGKLNPNSEKAMKAARDFAARDQEGFSAWCDAMPVVVPEDGRRVNDDGSMPDSKREREIKSAAAEYDKERKVIGCKKETFINVHLGQASMTPMTEDELKRFCAA